MTSPDSSETWSPLLDGALAERASETIQAIAAGLRGLAASGGSHRGDPALGEGLAGMAVFFAYLDMAHPGEGHDATSRSLLETAIEGLAGEPLSAGFYSGFTGIAWAVEHLRRRLSDGGGDLNQAVDEALEAHLGATPWRGDFDLVNGLVGLGVYALERQPRAGGCLALAADRLAELAEPGGRGGRCTWRTPQRLIYGPLRDRFPDGRYNLGVAHGVPGVLPFLAAAAAAGVEPAAALLRGSVSWLLDQRLGEAEESLFPSFLAPGETPRPARAAWCYGEPGIAAALLCAARRVGEPDWAEQALAIARLAATRPDRGHVRDAGLCHGAAGLGHVFHRLYRASREEIFATAARSWFERALEMRRPGEGRTGYFVFDPMAQDGDPWDDLPGFLTGAAGVALALLAATTSILPEWDRILLLSLAPTARSDLSHPA